MPRHLISDAHEWINEIPTVPIYYLAKPQPRERAWQNQRGKKTLESELNGVDSGREVASPAGRCAMGARGRDNLVRGSLGDVSPGDLVASLHGAVVKRGKVSAVSLPSVLGGDPLVGRANPERKLAPRSSAHSARSWGAIVR